MNTSTTHRPMRRLAAGAVLALAAFGIGGPAWSAADKVRVGVFPVSSALPYFIALERGYFKAQNIETEMTRLMGGPPLVAAMIGDQIDAAANLVTIEGMNANTKKSGVVMYIAINGQNKQYQMEQIVVRANHPARTIKDLKGAKFLSAPGPANMSMAHAVLAANGLKRSDYTLDQLGMPLHVGALKAGTFDAGYTLEPAATIAVNIGAARRIEAGVISTYILGRDEANTYAAGGALTSKFINAHPDVARRYALAWAKAIADIKSDEAGVRKHLIKNTFTPVNVAPTIPMVNYTMVRDLTAANLKDFQDFIDFAHKVNVLKQKVDVTKYLKKY